MTRTPIDREREQKICNLKEEALTIAQKRFPIVNCIAKLLGIKICLAIPYMTRYKNKDGEITPLGIRLN